MAEAVELEAETDWTEEEEEVEDWEVEEGEAPGDDTVTVRCWVVCSGEGRQLSTKKHCSHTQDHHCTHHCPDQTLLPSLHCSPGVQQIHDEADTEDSDALLLGEHGEGGQGGGHHAPAVLIVMRDCEEREESAEYVSSPHHSSHSLSVDR